MSPIRTRARDYTHIHPGHPARVGRRVYTRPGCRTPTAPTPSDRADLPEETSATLTQNPGMLRERRTMGI